MKPCISTRSRQEAFTLIELLVSVSIIAILASLVFGGFSRVMEGSRLSTCTANLKLLYSLAQQYTQDNNNALPPAMSTQSWMISLGKAENPQYTTTDPVQNKKYRCPEAAFTYPPAKVLRTYAMNAEGIPAATSISLLKNTHPAQTLYITDIKYQDGNSELRSGYAYFRLTSSFPLSQYGDARHHGRINGLFLDGHVALLALDDPKLTEYITNFGN
ncbi:hypothetical protein DB345_06165 [Spartobacteria bacterium LR76]|nr:hypothetical protein DB345_06165 [Spartobacteria bacterium LR76]